jgi:hypothetical protein
MMMISYETISTLQEAIFDLSMVEVRPQEIYDVFDSDIMRVMSVMMQ